MADDSRICSDCGLEIPSKARVCGHCGFREGRTLSERIGSNWLAATLIGALATSSVGYGISRLASHGSSASTPITSVTAATAAPPTRSPAEVAAQQVQACIVTHHMAKATDRVDGPPPSYLLTFRRCSWPPHRYDDPDGYDEVVIRTETVPGQSEASGASLADYIDMGASCPSVLVRYQLGSQGSFQTLAPLHVDKRSVTTTDGIVVEAGLRRALPTYPLDSEAVVLHNAKHGAASAECDDR